MKNIYAEKKIFSPSKNSDEKEKNKKGYCKAFCVTLKRNKNRFRAEVLSGPLTYLPKQKLTIIKLNSSNKNLRNIKLT